MPVFGYGIAFNTSDAMTFARERSLVAKPEMDMHGIEHVYATFDFISREAGLVGAKLVIPFADDYQWLLQLFTNHNYRKAPYTEQQRLRSVARAAELLGNGQRAFWWWLPKGRWCPTE